MSISVPGLFPRMGLLLASQKRSFVAAISTHDGCRARQWHMSITPVFQKSSDAGL